ncbi:hypothetical protein ACQEVC_45400 [Plantactinospora sp. CA-294935]|uniref:hypothetical protein n=1 Tax=Plantactinospora sp. CA-294935 TaxID=3240012 RepID=UPI003D9368F3
MTITTSHVLRNAPVITPTGMEYLVAVTYRDEDTEYMTAPTLAEDDERISEWSPEQIRLHADN